MYALGCDIGFVYAHITSGTTIPARLASALDPLRWVSAEPYVTEMLTTGTDVAVYTCALRGDRVPYILHSPVAEAPTEDDAACAYLSKYDASILDASLASFTARVIALAARYPAERQRLLDGVIGLHVSKAARAGVFTLLEQVRATGGVALVLNNTVDPPTLTRMGPTEIDRWLRRVSEEAAIGSVEWSGQMASDFALSALPMLPGAVYLRATITSDTLNETLIVCFPDDSASIRPEWLPPPPIAAPAAPSNVIQFPAHGASKHLALRHDDPY